MSHHASAIQPTGGMEKTSCSICRDTIAAGEYRVVLMAVEMKPEDIDEDGRIVPAGRGLSLVRTYCNVCCGNEEFFKIQNIWYLLRESDADPRAVSHPGQDASAHWVSARGVAEGLAGEQEGDEDVVVLEDAVLSDYRGGSLSKLAPTPEPPSEKDMRARVDSYLRSAKSRTLRPAQRQIATLWVEGKGQAEIGRIVRVDQSTVCRALAFVKGEAQKA